MAAVETAMSISDRSKARRSAFFGRRKGHALRPRQAELFDTLLPRLAIELARPAPSDLALLFPNPVDSVRLEIGFGGGEHMIAQAEQHPRTGFIGVEPFVNGMAKALAAIDLKNLSNIRLHFDDAVFLLEWLPPASLACVDLIHPRRERGRDRAHRASRRRVPLRNGRSGLCGLDAQTPDPIVRLRVDGGARRRLASRVVRLFRDALRSKGKARRPCALLSDLSQNGRRSADAE